MIGHLAAATPEEIEEAVAAARRAFPAWAAERPKARANALHRLGDLIAGDALNMARNMTIEQGKPVNEAQGEILKLAEICHFMAKKRLACKVTLCRMTLRVSKSCRARTGWGGGAITPWNYPAELVGWKLCASLAAGCTLIIKPAELTPYTALAIAENALKRVFLPVSSMC